MKASRIGWLVSVGALLAAVAHVVFPTVTIDGVTVTLLAIAAVPWLRPLFKSLELPGGVKIEFQDVQRVAERADRLGLLAPEAPEQGTQGPPAFSFLTVVDTDPNLALAGLRIELERRLRQLAETRGLEVQRRGIGQLLQDLNRRELIGGAERSVLTDLVGLLNTAVHGAEVDRDAAQWALDVGPRILQALDQRAAMPAVRYEGIAEHR